ncbi:uncharacterized protein [Gossypium hirsutum]|uniref:Retrotransposon gag domain-containing protein n=1 Tax=Gossypium hirsutum TaxID=3635 RepID=A0ABM3BA40_GOSHI|nr:uncharacterized protein LOC121224538 [Gossypium hirsutum]
MNEKLEKIQQKMMDKIMESQGSMMAKLTQLLTGGIDKGKGLVPNIADNEGPVYSAGLTSQQTGIYPCKSSITIKPQDDIETPINFQARDNFANPVIPDFDEMIEKMNDELPKQLKEKYKWLEEKLRAIEDNESYHGIDARELSLVPGLVLPHKFKMPEFEKYNGTSSSKAHITMFCRRMTGYVNNDQLQIHCFQDSLAGAASKWYNQLSRTQNMEKKSGESFSQYAQRWREASFITHLLGSSSKSFSDIIMNGEMIENAIRSGKIDAGEGSRRSASKKKENEVNNTSSYSKTITVNQPAKTAVNQQGSSKQRSDTRQNTEKLQFTPIPMSYKELYQNLFNAHVVAPHHLKPLQPLYTKWYDASAQCDYHARIVGYSIEHCTTFKKLVERLISMGVVKLDDSPSTENLLPNHNDNGVNMIGGSMGRKIKEDISEVKIPLRWVWKNMVRRGLIVSSLKRSFERVENYCEFHHEEGHEIQECAEFRALVQDLMDNKEMEFYEEVKEEGSICTSESLKVPRVMQPVVIISRPKKDEVPWSYECNITVPGKETAKGQFVRANPESMKEAIIGEQKGKIAEPVKEEEAVEFLKFLKNSVYNVVEQLHQQSACIFVLSLLLNSEVHRNALMKMLNETYVSKDIFVSKLDRLVNNISADNFIFFNDDEILPGGMGSTKALHITARCKGHILPEY